MIILPFASTRPADPALSRGWDAEQQLAHDLGRAFADAKDIRLVHGLRFAAPQSAFESDHAQIDHLVLHRSGIVLIESKSTGDGLGAFNIDHADQWTRCPGGRQRFNFESPLRQASRQADALRDLLRRADPPLLDKIVGVLQQHFGNFPILTLIAVANTARITGPGAAKHQSQVMKAEKIVERVRDEIASHRRATGVLGLLRENKHDRGIYNLSDAALDRVSSYLLAHHAPLRGLQPAPTRPAPAQPAALTKPGSSTATVAALEALSCRHCRSINVKPVYRKDYCLLCDECGRYTPIPRICPLCGKPATVHKQGPEFYRVCDAFRGGCGAHVVFARA